ncbi:MAG TPA: hypothetical protein PKX51_18185 [Cyclobacteriaceae bacterium]|nr:hypothetical protein [Cyclobacteriaceae bacterium]
MAVYQEGSYMLNVTGANHIIKDIPLTFMDPLHLACSQDKNVTGIVSVAYASFTDVFFIKHSAVFDVGRMTADFRFRVNVDTALECVQTFKSNKAKAHLSMASLEEDDLLNFRKTFYLEPCLKLHTHVLDLTGVHTLDEITSCSQGIVEINSFQPECTTVELLVLSGNQEEILSTLRTIAKSRKSRLLFYDEPKNAIIFSAKFTSRYEDIDKTLLRFTQVDKLLQTNRANTIAVKPFLPPPSSELPQQIDERLRKEGQPLENEGYASELEEILNKLNVGTNEPYVASIPVFVPIPEESSTMQPLLQETNRVLSGDIIPNEVEGPPITLDSYAIDVFKKLFNEFYDELARHTKHTDKLLSDGLAKLQAKHPGVIMQMARNYLDLPSDKLSYVLELAFIMFNHLNPISSFRIRKSLKEKLIILITNLYTEQYELLSHLNLLDSVSETYMRLKA